MGEAIADAEVHRLRAAPTGGGPVAGPAEPMRLRGDGAAGATRLWRFGQRLLVASGLLLVLSAVLAFRPVTNPGVQDCGAPVIFLLTGSDNRMIHLGDSGEPGEPGEPGRSRQATCRARALDAAGWAGRFFAAFLVLAGVGAGAGLLDDRLAYRRAPRFETLLRDLPPDDRHRHGLVPRVTVEELDDRLPPVERPDAVGIAVAGAAAAVLLPLAGPPAVVAAALAELRLAALALAVLCVAATVVAAAELRHLLGLRPRRPTVLRPRLGDRSVITGRARWHPVRPGCTAGEPANEPSWGAPAAEPLRAVGERVESLVAVVASGWSAAVRPLVGAVGVDVHHLRRRGASRAEAVARAEVLMTVALAVHLALAAPVALAVALERHPPAVIREPQLLLIGAVILLVVTGAVHLPARWRGLPVRPTVRAFGHVDRLVADPGHRGAMVALVVAQPLLRAGILGLCLVAFGARAPVLVVLLAALAAPVAVALSPTPAGAGTVEAVTMLLLMLLGGVDPGRAAGAALAYRLVTFWLPMVPGLVATRALESDPRSVTGRSVPATPGVRPRERPRPS